MSFKQNYNPNIKAKPGYYKGIWMDAATERKTAQALDNFGIKWKYHPSEPGYMLSNGLWYSPDFWLPDAKMYIECKDKPSPAAMGKAYGLVFDKEYPVLVIGYDWSKFFKYWYDMKPGELSDEDIEKMGGNPEIVCYSNELFLARCRFCGKYWFVAVEDSYTCACCGEYDGDGIFDEIHDLDGINDLFRAGQERAASKYEKYCKR